MSESFDAESSASSPAAAPSPVPGAGSVFARRLRQERQRRGLSQADLATQLTDFMGMPIDTSAISRIESEDRSIRLEEATACAAVLHLPVTALLVDDPAVDLRRAMNELFDELAAANADLQAAVQRVEQLTTAIQAAQLDLRNTLAY